MGLFHHLFKPRRDEAGEKTVEDNPSPADGEKPGSPANPNAFLQPKAFIHRGATPPPATTRIPPPLRPPERRGTPPPEPPREIVLTLGDILSHVPTQFLKTGMHDAKRELRFATDELTSDIARGRPTVPLSRIAAQCPDVFHGDIPPAADLQIRLPLQKLLDQLGLYTPRAVSPPAPVLAPVQEKTAEAVASAGEKVEPPPPAPVSTGSEPPVVAEPKPEAAAPPVEAAAPAPVGALPPVRMFVRPPPVLGLAHAEPAAPAVEERTAEEIAAATAPVEVSRVTAGMPPIEPPAPVIEPPIPEPIPAASNVSVQPPPAIRPMVILPPPVFASAAAEPLREMPSLVPPPFVFTAPPVQVAEVKPDAACEPAPSAPVVRPSPPLAFNAPPIPAPEPAPVAGSLDQDALQALFMTDETLDLPKLARLAAALPGVEACVLTVRGDTIQYGQLPIEADALVALAPQFAALRALGPIACVTVNAAQHSVSYFTRADLCLCAIHGPRGFLPGVREKLAALADTLAGT